MTQPVENTTVVNIERILADKYSIKLDFALYIYELVYQKKSENSRFRRIAEKASNLEKSEMLEILPEIYLLHSKEDKFCLLQGIEDAFSEEKFLSILSFLYKTVEKDYIYYGIVSSKLINKIKRASGC